MSTAEKTEIPNIVLAADDNYIQHAGVTIFSLLATRKTDSPINIYLIVEEPLTQKNWDNLLDITRRYNATLSPLRIPATQFEHLVSWGHLTRATYYRLAIPDMLPNAQKALYLDCDIIVRKDIDELYHTDITHYHLAAAAGVPRTAERAQALRIRLGTPLDRPHLNAGVMLLNLAKWRADHTCENVLQYVTENPTKIVYCEQDGINALLWDKWLRLPPKWNALATIFYWYHDSWKKQSELKKLGPDWMEAARDPCLVHFSGSTKPWHYNCINPYAGRYFYYLNQTAWKGYRPKDFSVGNCISKHRKLLKQWLITRVFH